MVTRQAGRDTGFSTIYFFLISLTTVLKINLVLFLMLWVRVVSISTHTQGLFV